MDLSIIIVSYNQYTYLNNCIDSIYRYTCNIDYEVIVVDNNSEDVKIHNLLKENSEKTNNFIFIRNESNLGYTKANNIGFGKATGDYLAFLNTDTILLNNSFQIMLNFLVKNPKFAACGPRLYNPDGSFQVSFYSFPTVNKTILKTLGVNKLLINKPQYLKFIRKFRKILPGYANLYGSNFEEIKMPIEVPWVTGACLVVKKAVFEEIDKFDENLNSYCNDMDLGLRIRNKGYQIYFIPEAELIHIRGWAKKNSINISLHYNGYKYYYLKYFKGLSKIILLILNNIEWSYERVALDI